MYGLQEKYFWYSDFDIFDIIFITKEKVLWSDTITNTKQTILKLYHKVIKYDWN